MPLSPEQLLSVLESKEDKSCALFMLGEGSHSNFICCPRGSRKSMLYRVGHVFEEGRTSLSANQCASNRSETSESSESARCHMVSWRNIGVIVG